MAIWAIHQDDKIFKDANKFNPDRYLNHPKLANEYATSADYENRDKFEPSSKNNPKLTCCPLHHYGYGSGRRMCPGIHLAERNMWRIAAKLIWAFDIGELPEKPLDVDAYTSSILVSPLPFQVSVKPRSEKHLACIKRELVEAQEFLKQYE
jgi:cytochrome P450